MGSWHRRRGGFVSLNRDIRSKEVPGVYPGQWLGVANFGGVTAPVC